MTITEFVTDLIRDLPYPEALEHMDLETAKIDLANFQRCDFYLPEGITPELYAKAWNELISK